MEEADILERIAPRFETFEEAYIWYAFVTVPGFSGQTARELVDQGRGQAVLEFVAACDAGVYT
ncbi:hypothetical protein U879_18675 [Defluviimonas sp. 20V17]|uniref:Antitoxin Xre/MbcA/ParS-like toxin-binding domain-containing protein n=1 Tax=Allgaiera indica TaxID=765699 RepID=A0AAN4URU3_9RHOB|nr:hypothetical protein [Allgaiera indica]KDB02160.1 hypothetical protein U879_18675 [Defluviimonas sp. 20V17]GHE02634.1 hypothetical protein GCM10008024_22960 [Allgaiera indica]SDX19990.1 hypothetical protein SAMN05444006_111132 [Allgaiera indica]